MKRVKITLKNGDLSYSPCCPKLDKGEELKWICNDGIFAVHIGYNSPLPKGRYRAKKGEETGDKILGDATPGDYKYSVSVYDGEYLWTDDPKFIIRRRK